MEPATDPTRAWWVICLCAEWCGACRQWRDVFMQVAAAQVELRFAWVDVEDEADAMGDVDIETFPTILIACDNRPLFLGPLQPSAGQLTRLIASLRENPIAAPVLPAGAAALMSRLAATVLPKL
jgi:thioredoxin-like negative regulator of GroEL